MKSVIIEIDAEELQALINHHADKGADAYVAGRVKELDRRQARREALTRLLMRKDAERCS